MSRGYDPGGEIAAIGATIIMVALIGSIIIIIFAIPAILALCAMAAHALIKQTAPEEKPLTLEDLLMIPYDTYADGSEDIDSWLKEGVIVGEGTSDNWLSG
jgi:hypothetical protein